jgi:hypothetical protein
MAGKMLTYVCKHTECNQWMACTRQLAMATLQCKSADEYFTVRQQTVASRKWQLLLYETMLMQQYMSRCRSACMQTNYTTKQE